jgi:radical SAM superfamily enzyme YgiQ (UPF0313 family)
MRVLLIQLPVPNNPLLNTPLAAGYLKTYAAARGLLAQLEIEILPRNIADYAGDAMLIEEIVARRPDLLGFSLYTWNSERSLAIAQRVRERLPDLRVLAGGPEVQSDNAWLLEHPALDVAVVGSGEFAFVELLEKLLRGEYELPRLIAGPALDDLAVLPSPYLAGYLEVPLEGMAMIEISRWCPYACNFCLYGHNMGPRLGRRYFGLERLLAEIDWCRRQDLRRVHFVEANLNLLPIFRPLMAALAELNADRQIEFYAELRAEHLSDEAVAVLAAANVRTVEVGLQSANPVALRASGRRTDLDKWVAGTRRLYRQGIEVLLDVIIGLPADDAAGIIGTVEFLRRQDFGPYDPFMLQVLPGTELRRQAAEYGMHYQERPPYYLLAGDQLSYAELGRLRRELYADAGLDPAAVEGLPTPYENPCATETRSNGSIISRLRLPHDARISADRLANHVSVVVPLAELDCALEILAGWISANPSSIFDLYVHGDGTVLPIPAELAVKLADLPYTPGYLDRVAVYCREQPDPAHSRVSPRCFLVLPWAAPVDPEAYTGIAEIIWHHV